LHHQASVRFVVGRGCPGIRIGGRR
jgi:hypothetical protein